MMAKILVDFRIPLSNLIYNNMRRSIDFFGSSYSYVASACQILDLILAALCVSP